MATRRIVTGNTAEGKSYFVHNGPTSGHLNAGVFQLDEIWVDDPARPDPASDIDPVDVDQFQLEPPVDGSTFRVFTFQPADATPGMPEEEVFAALSRFNTGNAMEEEDPGMHTTKTIDYGIVLHGEIYLELDEGEVHLKQGDVVVQRGTRHAWRNRSKNPCTIAFILVSSKNYR